MGGDAPLLTQIITLQTIVAASPCRSRLRWRRCSSCKCAKARINRVGLVRAHVRYASLATNFRIAAKRRYVPEADLRYIGSALSSLNIGA